jgi:Glycosyl hydrolase family 71
MYVPHSGFPSVRDFEPLFRFLLTMFDVIALHPPRLGPRHSAGTRTWLVSFFSCAQGLGAGQYRWVADSDAFALNVGREDWQKARVIDAYAAALQLQTGFRLFLSFDMT